jgi:hypothetical protein
MNEQLDKQLCEKFPKIFRDRHAPMMVTAMCWGFSHGDGWYNIIDALCTNIQHHVDESRKKRARALTFNRKLKRAIEMDSIEPLLEPGRESDFWIESAEEILKKKQFRDVPAKVHQIVASQVKEKFGGLRFYINGGDDVVYALISMAESMSVRTCEVCGKPGKTIGHGWYYTSCEEHAREGDWEGTLQETEE